MMQQEINKNWANKWEKKIYADKTQVMLLISTKDDTDWGPELKVNESSIKRVKENKFLGVDVSNDL